MSSNNEISIKLREITRCIEDLQENEDIAESESASDGLERMMTILGSIKEEFGDGVEDLLFSTEDDDEEEDDDNYEEEEEGEPLF